MSLSNRRLRRGITRPNAIRALERIRLELRTLIEKSPDFAERYHEARFSAAIGFVNRALSSVCDLYGEEK